MSPLILSISIALSGELWLLALLIPAGVLYILWGYGKVVPDISSGWKTILLILRISAVTLIFILLFDPVIVRNITKIRPPEIAVLIDNSASMGVVNRNEDRVSSLKKMLTGKAVKSLSETFSVKYYQFSDTLTELHDVTPDSLLFNGIESNIASALAQISKRFDSGEGAVLMLSDGAYNSGANPVRTAADLPFPVFTIAFGDSNPQLDLSVREIDVNPLVYTGDKTPVKVTLSGYRDAVSNLNLYSPSGELLESKNIKFSGGECKVDFDITPEEPGELIYRLSLTPTEQEREVSNNTRNFAVKALESRMKILILAGAPSADFAFLKRILSRDENIELTVRVEKRGGAFYQESKLYPVKEFDLVIMQNYPANESDERLLQEIFSGMRDDRLPLVIMAGDLIELRRLNPVSEILPFRMGRAGKVTASRLIPPLNPVSLTNFFPADIEWQSLPPVRYNPGLMIMREEAGILASFEDGTPAAGYISTAGEKVMAVSAYEMWRLVLQDPEHSHGDSLVSNFWLSAVRWLSTREEEELFQVRSGRKVYPGGAPIKFSAKLYDKAYKPLNGAEVKLSVNGPEGRLDIVMTPSGGGEYRAETRLVTEGEYRFAASAIAGNDTLFHDGKIMVESFNPELLNPMMRPDMMRGIAVESGGKMYLPEEFSRFYQDYTPQPVEFTEEQKYKMFPKTAVLIILLGLLSLEWFIRKRKGLL